MSSDETCENTPASPGDGNQISETYWPRLREVLEKDPSGMDRLSLECMICKTPMTLNPHSNAKVEGNPIDHRAMILLCGHLVGFRCMYDYFTYCRARDQPFGCPLDAQKLHHPVCGCCSMGWPLPGKVEDFSRRLFTIAEGLALAPSCLTCVLDGVVKGLTILTCILEPDLSAPLKSFQAAYRVQIGNLVWGEFEDDERESVELEPPASMREHYRNMEVSLVTHCHLPDHVVRDGNAKVSLFWYNEALERDEVSRRLGVVADPGESGV